MDPKEWVPRDKRAERSYFSYYLTHNRDTIISLESAINGERRPELFNPDRYGTIYATNMCMLMAMYSRGDDLEHIRTEFLKMLPKYCQYWSGAEYANFLSCVSFAVLLEADQEDFYRIKEAFSRFKIGRKTSDWLINYLIHSRLPEVDYRDSPIYYKTYLKYKEMIEGENPEEEIYLYLKRRWYNAQRGECWWGEHKNVDRGFPIYFGYWAFDLAAVVRALGIDDSKWDDLKYYPYDLARFRHREE